MALSILAGRDRISLENGFDLRLLSALEILQARREGEELSGDGGAGAVLQRLPAGPGAGADRGPDPCFPKRPGGAGRADRGGNRCPGRPVERLQPGE